VRTGRVASFSSGYNSRKAKPFGIHFDFCYCRPIPSNVNLKKKRQVCIFFALEGHGDHNVKRVHATAERLGEDDTCYNIIKDASCIRYSQGWVRVRKSRIKGERKGV
jgi:hypothetical protein